MQEIEIDNAKIQINSAHPKFQDVSIAPMHTSGHCDMDSLCKIFPLLSPKEIIPIHTDAPELFAQCFNKYWPVRLLQDGDIFILGNF